VSNGTARLRISVGGTLMCGIKIAGPSNPAPRDSQDEQDAGVTRDAGLAKRLR
jgi:hypothetical protein